MESFNYIFKRYYSVPEIVMPKEVLFHTKSKESFEVILLSIGIIVTCKQQLFCVLKLILDLSNLLDQGSYFAVKAIHVPGRKKYTYNVAKPDFLGLIFYV